MAGPHTIGWNYGTSGSNSTRSGSVVSWNRFVNLFSDDGNCETLTWTYPWGGYSDWAIITGFDFSSLPSDAVITGIRVKIRARYLAISGYDVHMDSIYVTKNGTGYQDRASDDSSNWPGTLTDKYWGTTSTLWGTTWTRNEAASQIGVQFSYWGNTYTDGGSCLTDSIAVEVTYFIPSLSPSISPSISSSISSSISPSISSSISRSISPSISTSKSPSLSPSISPSKSPSISPSQSPSASISPSISPSKSPSISPSFSPSISPSPSPGWKDFTRGDYIVLPTTNDDLETTYTAQNITDVSSSNGIRVDQTATDQYAIHQFKHFATSNVATIQCICQSTEPCSTAPVILEVFKYSTGQWEELDRDSVTDANTNITLDGNIPVLTNYKDPGGVVTCRVYQDAVWKPPQ